MQREQEPGAQCDDLGRDGARFRRTPRTYGTGNDLLVIENVPVIACRHCGESYLTPETLHEIERIRSHRAELAVRRSVAVASFV